MGLEDGGMWVDEILVEIGEMVRGENEGGS